MRLVVSVGNLYQRMLEFEVASSKRFIIMCSIFFTVLISALWLSETNPTTKVDAVKPRGPPQGPWKI